MNTDHQDIKYKKLTEKIIINWVQRSKVQRSKVQGVKSERLSY